MGWQKVHNLEVGTGVFADGEWLVSDDEMETKMEVKSNGLTSEFTISPGLDPSSYPVFAELMIKGLNSVTRRE